jgi:hypothetical protein
MKTLLITACICLGFGMANAQALKETDKEYRKVVDVLRQVGDAWNKGDADKFLSFFVKSNDLKFSSEEGSITGYDNFAKFQKENNFSAYANRPYVQLNIQSVEKRKNGGFQATFYPTSDYGSPLITMVFAEVNGAILVKEFSM